MAAVELAVEDLAPFADIPADKAEQMIEDALGLAELVAPCIVEDEFAYDRAAKAVLRGAILRWHEAGQGVTSQLQALGFSQMMDTRQPRRAMFWPSEIQQLQAMCRTNNAGDAFAIDMAPEVTVEHADICDVNLITGGNCSCGAILTAHAALWENY